MEVGRGDLRSNRGEYGGEVKEEKEKEEEKEGTSQRY